MVHYNKYGLSPTNRERSLIGPLFQILFYLCLIGHGTTMVGAVLLRRPFTISVSSTGPVPLSWEMSLKVT